MGENRIVPWKQGFLCVDGIKLILSSSLSPDVNLAFTLVPSLPLNSFNSAYVRDGVHIEIS